MLGTWWPRAAIQFITASLTLVRWWWASRMKKWQSYSWSCCRKSFSSLDLLSSLNFHHPYIPFTSLALKLSVHMIPIHYQLSFHVSFTSIYFNLSSYSIDWFGPMRMELHILMIEMHQWWFCAVPWSQLLGSPRECFWVLQVRTSRKKSPGNPYVNLNDPNKYVPITVKWEFFKPQPPSVSPEKNPSR